eukprot:233115-Pyramimonas_sp.AAC.1
MSKAAAAKWLTRDRPDCGGSENRVSPPGPHDTFGEAARWPRCSDWALLSSYTGLRLARRYRCGRAVSDQLPAIAVAPPFA